MNSNSLKELAIKSPRRYKIALAIAKGLNEGKQLKEVFVALGINQNTGYSVATQLKKQIAEMRSLQGDEGKETSRKLLAKKLLDDATPEAAQELINLMKDKETPKRERRQACKDILQLAEIGQQKPSAEEGLKSMRAILANIYKDCNITLGNVDKSEDRGNIDAEIVEEPQITQRDARE